MSKTTKDNPLAGCTGTFSAPRHIHGFLTICKTFAVRHLFGDEHVDYRKQWMDRDPDTFWARLDGNNRAQLMRLWAAWNTTYNVMFNPKEWVHPRPGHGTRLNRQEIKQREALIDRMAPDATKAERVSIRQLFHRSGDTLGRCIVGVMARQKAAR